MLVIARSARASGGRSSRRRTTRCSPTTTRPRCAPTCSASTRSGSRSARFSVRSSAAARAAASAGGSRSSCSSIPTLVFVVLGLRLQRAGARPLGTRPRRGATEAVVGTDEVPPSFAESIRILWQVGTLRRIWYSLPFLAASFIGLVTLTSLYYEQVFHLDDVQRGLVAALRRARADRRRSSLGIPLASRLMLRDPASACACSRSSASSIAGRVDRCSRSRPRSGSRSRCTSSITGAVVAARARHLRRALARRSRPRCASLGLLDGRRCSSCPGCSRSTSSAASPTPTASAPGLLIMVPIFLIGAWILASGVDVREVRHQPGVDLDRRAGRGACSSASRAR